MMALTSALTLPPPIPAFLPTIPVLAPSGHFSSAHTPSPTCSSQPAATRRIFLTRLLRGTSTIILAATSPLPAFAVAGAIDPSSDPALNMPTKPRTKPRRVTWGYAAENGPSTWASLSPDWALCDSGAEQSPIALSYRDALAAPADTPRPLLATAPAKFSVKFKEVLPFAANRSVVIDPYIPPPPPLVGDAPPVDGYMAPRAGAVVTVGGVTYVLRSFHFHLGRSEHVLDGVEGVMETHFIFDKRAIVRDGRVVREAGIEGRVVPPAKAAALAEPTEAAKTGGKAAEMPSVLVVGLIGMAGEETAPWLQDIIDKFEPQMKEDDGSPGIVIDLDMGKVLPDFKKAVMFNYPGSLTTPPGTEGLYWLVLGNRMSVSDSDLATLLGWHSGPNFRPLQNLNGRKVVRFPDLSVGT